MVPPSASPAAITLRRFRANDISFASELRAVAGWNQTREDWRGYLKFAPEGCFVADVGGRPAGTATTIGYENKFGWIGMVLVHPDFRRRGIGTLLLQRAIAHLQASGVRSVKLDATPMGKTVYGPLGFVEEYSLSRYEGPAPARSAASGDGKVGAFTPADVAAVARFDAGIFGAERPGVLAELSARNPEWCFVEQERGEIRGYLIARAGARAVQVGPWVAREPETAARLWGALCRRVAGRPMFVDVLGPNAAGVALLTRQGFRVQRSLTRMFLGENPAPGRPELIYSGSGGEKG